MIELLRTMARGALHAVDVVVVPEH
jgi:hypothetical protein